MKPDTDEFIYKTATGTEDRPVAAKGKGAGEGRAGARG